MEVEVEVKLEVKVEERKPECWLVERSPKKSPSKEQQGCRTPTFSLILFYVTKPVLVVK